MVLKRSELRGQQGHNSFNRPVKAAVGRNEKSADDSADKDYGVGPAGSPPLREVIKNAWIPRLEDIVLGRNGGSFQALKQAAPNSREQF
ncbi:hypothetical protein U8Q07_08025 [Rhizobium ruizarguesonis]|nr:hypothetical protein U8Q07_08025 [Rhizobium ruizarguesonis]